MTSAIDPNHPYDTCGGPTRCRYCAELFHESGERASQRVNAENRARGLRVAAASSDAPPPDPYAAGLAKLRAELPSTKWPDTQPPSSSKPSNTPPDPYQAALDKLKGTK
jgi:hypothetical protein